MKELPTKYCVWLKNSNQFRELINSLKNNTDIGCLDDDEYGFPTRIAVIDGCVHSWGGGFTEISFEEWKSFAKPMTDDIWKDAPEGATHYSKVMKDGFYKKNGDNWFYFNTNKNEWRLSHASDNFHNKLIPRPTQDWHKNNELPPIGTVCEFFIPNHISQSKSLLIKSGASVEILFHFNAHGRGVAAYKFMVDGEMRIDYAISDCFRPIKSDREKAIDNLSDLIKSNIPCYKDDADVCASALYDAGLRFMTQDTER